MDLYYICTHLLSHVHLHVYVVMCFQQATEMILFVCISMQLQT